ncbi:LLM class flavin-dependent oxidoreductase [Yinghuangia seranimata]|uniref:LLM class flavin-dependent oxidoreductase n=1 Tax=Yinghuangia seranimata TaxID=408067 RepID=UPI00248AC54A|nr:LLM class flavin-dependent oxidoreductase [Yinghuangia seranimata]MDI2130441.1 LLM class flavin-dependent oxidoreductase [Yinghuangia seranimata]
MQSPLFGFGASTAVDAAADTLRLIAQADRDGLDLFTVSDHPYFGDRLDAYALVSTALGATSSIGAAVSVSNLPTRPAPMLARTITSLSTLTGGRVALGLGVGGLWDDIARMGFPKLSPGAAVRAFEEAIPLIRALSGGGEPVTFHGEFHHVTDLQPAAAPAVPIWTGSVGPKSLAATGRLADGWFPGHAADWLSPRYRESRPIIDEAAHAAGRDPRDIATIYNIPGVITPTDRPNPRDPDGTWRGGSVAQWTDALTEAVLDHDASGFVHFTVGGTPPENAVAVWSNEIAPAVREAVTKARASTA